MISVNRTDNGIAMIGLRVMELAPAGGPTRSANMSSAPTIGTLVVVAAARRKPNTTVIVRGLMPRAAAVSGRDDANSRGCIQLQWREDTAHQGSPSARARRQIRRGSVRIVARDLRGILSRTTDEQGSEAEHSHQRQRGYCIVPGMTLEDGDGEGASHGEEAKANEGIETKECRASGTGESAVGDGMGKERVASDHHEEANDPAMTATIVPAIQALVMNGANIRILLPPST